MTEQTALAPTTFGNRDEVKELAARLQKMMPGSTRFTEAEALTVAQIAVSHNLDPFNGEVWGIKYERNQQWVWAGVMVGIKGLRKSARRQGNYWTEFRRVEPKQYDAPANAVVYECHLRDTERVQSYGKSINALTTSGVPYPDAVKMLGPAPVYIGVGIATQDEKSKMSIHARAKKRAESDAIKQAYDVQFGGAMIENGSSIVEGEVTVLGFDDDHQLPAETEAPRTEQQSMAELGFDPEMSEYEYTDEQPAPPEQPAQPAAQPANVYEAVVAAGLADNVIAAKNALHLCKTGYDTHEKAIAWMRNYRGWRDLGGSTEQAAKHANAGETPK